MNEFNEFMDSDLRSRFETLRAAEVGSAPVFREMLERGTVAAGTDRGGWRHWSRLAIPIALAAAVAVAVGIAGVARRHTTVQAPLSMWTSPTAGLLRTSGLGLLGPTNSISASLSPSLFSKGTRR